MSYKINLKDPIRKSKLKIRRMNQLSMRATRQHPQIFRIVRIAEGYRIINRNKYIISGPNANVRQPQDVIWTTREIA